MLNNANKIDFPNSPLLYHKPLPLYRKRSCARKNILPERYGRFTSKELDGETGLYYYGARYLDPRTSRWLSGDPALGEYLPGAPVNDEARKRNGNLPGGGGIFNLVNLHVYHYAGNNPVKYVDPDGRTDIDHENKTIYADLNNRQDLEDAAGLLLGYQNHGYNVTAGDGNDNSMQFNNARGMNSFLEDNPGEIDISSLESVINIGGSAVTLGYLAQYAENGASAARGLGKVATGLNAVSILIDGAQFLQDPNLDTGSDLLFTAIGFAGTPGAAASLGLTYTKKGIVEGSKTLTNFSMGYEKFYINRWSQSLFGVNIK